MAEKQVTPPMIGFMENILTRTPAGTPTAMISIPRIWASAICSDWDASQRDPRHGLRRCLPRTIGSKHARLRLFQPLRYDLLSRWTRTLTESSGFTLQMYYDRTDRRDPLFSERRNTGDVDFQYRFPLPGRQYITLGLGYRNTADQVSATGFSFFDRDHRMLELTEEQLPSG